MSEAKRYTFVPALCRINRLTGEKQAEMLEDKYGIWIEHSAYTTLKAENARLREALKACQLQMLQSNNDSEWAQEAGEFQVACGALYVACEAAGFSTGSIRDFKAEAARRIKEGKQG